MKALPPQIKFIIGNEAAERFSFYGMRNILTVFLVDYLLSRATAQSERGGAGEVDLPPLRRRRLLLPAGGALADRFLGKYRTILLALDRAIRN